MGNSRDKDSVSKPHVLYISRTGMLEPLGQTQVLNYLGGLSKTVDFTLITFERKSSDSEKHKQVESFCARHSIQWIELPYRNRPRFLAGLINIFAALIKAFKVQRRRPITFVHARSYIPAIIALAMTKIYGVPYVFDLRGLWPEELITSQRIKRNSLLHRLIDRFEEVLIKNAAIVVSVTKAGIDWLSEKYGPRSSLERSYVIPGSADLDRFSVNERGRDVPIIIGCHGSILNGWFRPDLLGKAFALLAKRFPSATFEVVTPNDSGQVLSSLGDTSVYHDRLKIYASPVNDISDVLSRHDLSVFFYSGGMASELGRSPVRMGEALGSGLPVLTNTGVGDVAEIVRENEVGVVIRDDTDEGLEDAVDRVSRMIRDPEVRARCRHTAERIFSLSVGTSSYQNLYDQMLSDAAQQDFK